jgi:hypothetical protein
MHWHAKQEKWYFAMVDVIAALTDSPKPPVYWRVLAAPTMRLQKGKI